MTNFTDTIRNRVSMLDVCKHYGIHVDRGGFACCPFHGEKTASMKCYPGNRGFYCFGCHQGGDIIRFTRQYFGIDFLTAVSKLNDDFCLGLPINQKRDEESEKAARQEAYRRRKAELHRRKVLESLQNARDAALSDFAKLDRLVDNLSSEANLCGLESIAGPDVYNAILDSIDDKTAHALNYLDNAWYELQEAEAKLRDFRNETANNKTNWR